MTYILTILRKERGSPDSVWQSFAYDSHSENDTVASALSGLNRQETLTDINGLPSSRIEWECSCLQKKCGACAMVIGNRPQLACDARLAAFKSGEIKIEPLRKFPVVRDLVVDRSILYENLKTLRLWLKQNADLPDRDRPLAYEASECIQCGCCLEVCPNFYVGGKFFGMSTVPITTRLLSEMTPDEYRDLAKLYTKHTFEGCGKSLACRDICPKKIDTEKLLVNANALAIWKRERRK